MSNFILTGLMALFVLTGSAGHAAQPELQTYQVAMTGYNAVSSQTDGDPTTTASGGASDPDVVAARSRDLAEELPYGTVISVEPSTDHSTNCGLHVVGSTIGYRVIADTMNARITNTVDILFATDDTFVVSGNVVNAARTLGMCEDVTIRVVGKIDITKPSQLPKSQAALVAMIGASQLAVK